MPASFDYPAYWKEKNSMPDHWKGCLYTWLYSGSRKIFSQCGQDLIVDYMTPPYSDRLFIDFGANDGITGSSTYLLEHHGWKGLLIEPNLEQVSNLLKTRKKSQLLPVAVGHQSSVASFAAGSAHTLNTLLTDPNSLQYKRLHKESNKEPVIKYVPTLCVYDILKVFNGYFSREPNFIKIDVEGYEYQVVSDLMKNNCFPDIIEVENNNRLSTCADILIANGYHCEIVMDSFVEIYSRKRIDKERILSMFTS